MQPHLTSSNDAAAQRKRQLLAESAVYRASLVASIQEVRHSLHTDSRPCRVAGFVVATALGILKTRTGKTTGLPGVLPLAIEAFSLVSTRPWLKKTLRWTAAAAIVAGIWVRRQAAIRPRPER